VSKDNAQHISAPEHKKEDALKPNSAGSLTHTKLPIILPIARVILYD